MFNDLSIIKKTPIGVLPFSTEIQNIVFEFIHGSTALYQHKIRFTPLVNELAWRLRYKLAMEEKVCGLVSVLTRSINEGFVRNFGLFQYDPSSDGVSTREYRRHLMMIPTAFSQMVFDIQWIDAMEGGPQFVEVWYDYTHGSLYMTQQFFVPEGEDSPEPRVHLTLDDFGYELTQYMIALGE